MNEANQIERPVMQFEMTHKISPGEPVKFTEATAPDWLTSVNTQAGSTMDTRWFWQKRVLTLPIGGSIDTDFRRITRTA